MSVAVLCRHCGNWYDPEAVRAQRKALAFGSIRLTPKQRLVARLIRDRGLSTPEIAKEMGCSTSAAKHHVITVFRKMGVHTRIDLVRVLLKPLNAAF